MSATAARAGGCIICIVLGGLGRSSRGTRCRMARFAGVMGTGSEPGVRARGQSKGSDQGVRPRGQTKGSDQGVRPRGQTKGFEILVKIFLAGKAFVTSKTAPRRLISLVEAKDFALCLTECQSRAPCLGVDQSDNVGRWVRGFTA